MSFEVGLVGCGGIAPAHVRAWRGAGAEVVAICDINQEAALAFKREWKIPEAFPNVQEMAQIPGLSILDICTPPATHCELACQSLSLGLHVVVEKPLAESTDEAQEMIKTADEAKRLLTVTHSILFEPIILKMLSLIRKGVIGKVERTFIAWPAIKEYNMTMNPNHWAHRLRGGRFGETLPHLIYLARAIAGDCQVKDVQAIGRPPYPWMKVSDVFVLLEQEHSHSFLFLSFGSPRTIMPIIVEGDKGRLIVKPEYGVLFVDTKQKTFPSQFRVRIEWASHCLKRELQEIIGQLKLAHHVIIPPPAKGHETLFSLFLQSIEKGTPPPVSAQEAYATTRVVEEICIALDNIT